MEEYKTERYIAKKDGELCAVEKYFSGRQEYDCWRRVLEEKALCEFYNAKIKR